MLGAYTLDLALDLRSEELRVNDAAEFGLVLRDPHLLDGAERREYRAADHADYLRCGGGTIVLLFFKLLGASAVIPRCDIRQIVVPPPSSVFAYRTCACPRHTSRSS